MSLFPTLDLQALSGYIRAGHFASYSCFVRKIYDQNEEAMLAQFRHDLSLAKCDIFQRTLWTTASWDLSKITIYCARGIDYLEYCQRQTDYMMLGDYINLGVPEIINNIETILSNLESSIFKQHYINACAVAQPVLERLYEINELLKTMAAEHAAKGE